MVYKFDYRKLRGRIREKGLIQEEIAKKIKVAPATLSQKLNNASEFTQSEIFELCDILEINHEELSDYFFAEVV